MQHRAWSTLEIKSIDEDARVLTGIASTPETDRMGDIMEPKGAVFKLPLPLLFQHNAREPIGEVFAAKVTPKGIEIQARIAKVSEPAKLKDRLDESWALIKARLVRGLSIGWSPIEIAPQRTAKGGMHVLKWLWAELSTVTIPANSDASIQTIKSLDQFAPAAPGTGRAVPSTPGASGSRKATSMHANISEQITAEQATLQAKSARLEELERDDETNGGLEEAEAQERDTLTTEVQSLVKRLERLRTMESAQAAQSTAVSYATPQLKAAPRPRIEMTDYAKELPKGTLFARYAMAVAAGKGSLSDTLAYAKRWDAQTPQVTQYIKAVEGTSVVQSPGWGGELVFQNNLAGEFVELIRPLTIIGRVPGFRNVPFNVRVPVQSGGSTVNWVGEAAPKPVTELSFTTLTVPHHKIAGIIVLTDELVRLSSPSAEETVRRDLTDQIAQFMDEQFIRVSVSAGANNPASITQGVTSPAASGTTLAALMADLQTALGTFDTAGIPTEGLVIVTTPAVARILSLMVTTLGTSPSGFNLTATGGTLLGYPVIVSASVDAATIVIFKPSEVFLADDGRVTLDASNQATLDMSGGSSPDFNLWQKNCIGIRAERWITWVKRRAGAVAVIDTVAYVPGT